MPTDLHGSGFHRSSRSQKEYSMSPTNSFSPVSDTMSSVSTTEGLQGAPLQGALRRTRSRKVCTSCRQAKTKCDAVRRFPASCSRCQLSSTPCRIDPHFKRVRRRNQSLELSPVELPVQTILDRPEPVTLPLNGIPDEPDETIGVGIAAAIMDEFTIGNVRLTLHQASYFFNVFWERFHPLCPILLWRREPIETYINERFLFWAIICVAGRTVMSDPAADSVLRKDDYLKLMEGVKEMATALSVWAGRSLCSVQGLLLLSEWCFPTLRQKDDRSWHFMNLAIQTGLLMGLHRPYHSYEFSSRRAYQAVADSVTGRERTLAWMMCRATSHLLAADVGVPSLLPDDWVGAQAVAHCGRSDQPDWLKGLPESAFQVLVIGHHVNKVTSLLGHSTTTPSGQLESPTAEAVWTALEQEWAQQELQFTNLQPHLDFGLLLARIRLTCCGLQVPSFAGAMRAKLASQLHDCCLRAIHLANAQRASLIYWPRSSLQGLKPAALALLRLVASADGKSLPAETAYRGAEIAYTLLMDLNIFGNDKFLRAAKLIAFTLLDVKARRAQDRLYGTPQGQDFAEIRTRIGLTNYYHDCLATAKRCRRNHISAYEPLIEATVTQSSRPPEPPSMVNMPPEQVGDPFSTSFPPMWLQNELGLDMILADDDFGDMSWMTGDSVIA